MGRKLHYRHGSYYVTSDRTGFPTRAEDTKVEWNGLRVEEKVWEPRQPQDLVRGVKDIQSVPNARPLAPNVFVGPISVQTIANAVIGQKVIQVQSIAGFSQGNKIGAMLDSGDVFFTFLALPPSNAGLTLQTGLPGTVASGNLITAYIENAAAFVLP